MAGAPVGAGKDEGGGGLGVQTHVEVPQCSLESSGPGLPAEPNARFSFVKEYRQV